MRLDVQYFLQSIWCNVIHTKHVEDEVRKQRRGKETAPNKFGAETMAPVVLLFPTRVATHPEKESKP